MELNSVNAQRVGVDLTTVWGDFRATWGRWWQWTWLSWLTPDVPVRVVRADGTHWLWDGHDLSSWHDTFSVQFMAVEIPAEDVLFRSMSVPEMSGAQVEQAAALDVSTMSPFASSDLAWGYVASSDGHGGYRVVAALASRKQVLRHLASHSEQLVGRSPEVWAFAASSPIVLRGWTEESRARYASSRRHIRLALLLGALLLAACIAVTPLAQLRLRAIDAAVGYSSLQQRVAPLSAQRETYLRVNEALGKVSEILLGQVDAIALLEQLPHVFTGDITLQSLEVKGTKVLITGLTPNAAALMQRLGQERGFKDVRAPVAAVRSPGAALDSFNIEFQLDPGVWSTMAQAKPVVSAPGAPNALPIAGHSGAATQAAGGVPGPNASDLPQTATPPKPSRFSSGGDAPVHKAIPGPGQVKR